MDSYTMEVKHWLEERFAGDVKSGEYHAHQPIYGFGRGDTEPGHLVRLARTFKLLQLINRLEFTTALDVGGAEGYLAHHIRDLFGATTITSDLSLEANRRAWELYGLQGIGIHASQLPFQDGSFDLVVCSEVIEHVENAVDAILELDRISCKYLVITTQEASRSRWERWLRLKLRDFSHPHYELNWWHPTDITSLLGDNTSYSAQAFLPPLQEINSPENDLDESQAKSLVQQISRELAFGTEGSNGLLIWKKKAPMLNKPKYEINELLDHLFKDRIQPEFLEINTHVFDPSILTHLCCPLCMKSLEYLGDSVICNGCEAIYTIEYGIPLMYPDKERPKRAYTNRASSLKQLFRRDNIAQSENIRKITHHLLMFYYSYRSFQKASLVEKFRKILRLIPS